MTPYSLEEADALGWTVSRTPAQLAAVCAEIRRPEDVRLYVAVDQPYPLLKDGAAVTFGPYVTIEADHAEPRTGRHGVRVPIGPDLTCLDLFAAVQTGLRWLGLERLEPDFILDGVRLLATRDPVPVPGGDVAAAYADRDAQDEQRRASTRAWLANRDGTEAVAPNVLDYARATLATTLNALGTLADPELEARRVETRRALLGERGPELHHAPRFDAALDYARARAGERAAEQARLDRAFPGTEPHYTPRHT